MKFHITVPCVVYRLAGTHTALAGRSPQVKEGQVTDFRIIYSVTADLLVVQMESILETSNLQSERMIGVVLQHPNANK